MTIQMCKRCGEFMYSGSCGCKSFTVIDQDGDNHQVWAFDEYFAALKWAQDSNECNDYYLMDQFVDITVNGKKFSVSAEPDIRYSATPLDQ